MTEARTWPDVAVPPGELLAETLQSLGMTQAELARRMGRPMQAISEIVHGSKEITAHTALQLERVIGVPAHVWIRLEADYRCNLARMEETKRLLDEIPLADKYPYKEMASHGWVPEVREKTARVLELLKFFRVSSLRHLESRERFVEWRRSPRVEISREALIAWLAQGEHEAEANAVTTDFNRDQLRRRLPDLRRLTREKAESSARAARQILGDAGVALVFVAHLKRTGVHGATQWFGQRALIQLSVRYRWSDIFWFSFFHELGHLLLHHRRGVFVNPEGREKVGEELEADAFAKDTLIPSDKYAAFRQSISRPSTEAVVSFAESIEIGAELVVGRLQHDKVLRQSEMNHLRPRLEIVQS